MCGWCLLPCWLMTEPSEGRKNSLSVPGECPFAGSSAHAERKGDCCVHTLIQAAAAVTSQSPVHAAGGVSSTSHDLAATLQQCLTSILSFNVVSLGTLH